MTIKGLYYIVSFCQCLCLITCCVSLAILLLLYLPYSNLEAWDSKTETRFNEVLICFIVSLIAFLLSIVYLYIIDTAPYPTQNSSRIWYCIYFTCIGDGETACSCKPSRNTYNRVDA
jgi:amino acid transporter